MLHIPGVHWQGHACMHRASAAAAFCTVGGSRAPPGHLVAGVHVPILIDHLVWSLYSVWSLCSRLTVIAADYVYLCTPVPKCFAPGYCCCFHCQRCGCTTLLPLSHASPSTSSGDIWPPRCTIAKTYMATTYVAGYCIATYSTPDFIVESL